MPIEFLCPQCKTMLATPDGTSGLHAQCPTCQLTMVIPDLESRPPSETAVLNTAVLNNNGEKEDDPESTDQLEAVGLAPNRQSGVWVPPEDADEEFPPPPPLPRPPKPALDLPSSTWSLISEAASPVPMNPKQLFQPAPSRFSLQFALSYGWKLFTKHWKLFVLASALVIGILLFHATIIWTNTLLSPGGIASTLFVVAFLPVILASLAAMISRAARGLNPRLPILILGFFFYWRIFRLMTLWLCFLVLCHLPVVVLGVFCVSFNFIPLKLLGIAILLIGSVLIWIRIGWVPFIVMERPDDNLFGMIRFSWQISSGKTFELLQTILLMVCAMCGTLLLLGIPIAMGIGGGTYVLLTRDHAKLAPS